VGRRRTGGLPPPARPLGAVARSCNSTSGSQPPPRCVSYISQRTNKTRTAAKRGYSPALSWLGSLAVRRHLCLLERHMLANDWVVLLQLQLALHRALVLPRVVRETCTSRGNETDVVAHNGPLLPRRARESKPSQGAKAGRLSARISSAAGLTQIVLPWGYRITEQILTMGLMNCDLRTLEPAESGRTRLRSWA